MLKIGESSLQQYSNDAFQSIHYHQVSVCWTIKIIDVFSGLECVKSLIFIDIGVKDEGFAINGFSTKALKLIKTS